VASSDQIARLPMYLAACFWTAARRASLKPNRRELLKVSLLNDRQLTRVQRAEMRRGESNGKGSVLSKA